MIKNLKLNIKNAQLAEALQKHAPSTEEVAKPKVRAPRASLQTTIAVESPKVPAARRAKTPKVEAETPSEPQPAPRRARILREQAAPVSDNSSETPVFTSDISMHEERVPTFRERENVDIQHEVSSSLPQAPSDEKAQSSSSSLSRVESTVETPRRSSIATRPGPGKPGYVRPDKLPSAPEASASLPQTSRGSTSSAPSSDSPAPERRGPRPEGASFERRGAKAEGASLERRGPRPEGAPFERRARPEGASYENRGPRPEGAPFERRGPRPEGAPFERRARPEGAPYENRGPRPEGVPFERRGPRPEGAPFERRGPRPEGAPFERRGPRPEGSSYENRPRTPYREGDSFRPRESSGESGSSPRLRESFSDRQARNVREQQERFQQSQTGTPMRPRLGPTGRHFRDLVPGQTAQDQPIRYTDQEKAARAAAHQLRRKEDKPAQVGAVVEGDDNKADTRSARTFDRSKPSKAIKKTVERVRIDTTRIDEDAPWRKRRPVKRTKSTEDMTIRPAQLHVRLPIQIKDLAQEMKLKASQLVAKLFLQGLAVTLNDVLDDETTIQLLGHEFGCEIVVDRREDERIQITSKNVQQEIASAGQSNLVERPPVVAFMGHVDHGKTSLVDAIRKSNRVAGEAGAITQHIGAFSCHTDQGDLTILDTPGHEAFAAMRERGALVTDVIVLVIAGDEGIKPQTDEAINHARGVQATILVAINKCDKPSFNVENVYRQLAERELLPEAWGGKTITVNCSAVTGEGIKELLEMVALQAEVLELRASMTSRARGRVIEAELHKGLGNVATILVQNGTLHRGDALVFNQSFGRVKTMRDEFDRDVENAKPSQAVRITGLSSLPEAGEEFIVVENEKEAKEIAEVRAHQIREKHVMQTRKKFSMEALLQHSQKGHKTLNCILRADVQGSVEALRFELMKIKSDKVDINIVFEGIGEVSESDIELAAASGAVVIGFHTRIEAHAEELIKQHKVKVRSYDVIYHAVDGVRELMAEQLDKIAEEHPRGKAQVKAIFRSSQLGKIAGCQVTEGTILRSYRMRVVRGGEVISDGPIASLRRGKDDVREISKGFECGILLQDFKDLEVDDMLESYEIQYRSQSL